MCGKAGCLMWLYNAGHSVIGLEGVVHVAEEVFTGNKLEYTKTVVPEIEGIKFQVRIRTSSYSGAQWTVLIN